MQHEDENRVVTWRVDRPRASGNEASNNKRNEASNYELSSHEYDSSDDAPGELGP